MGREFLRFTQKIELCWLPEDKAKKKKKLQQEKRDAWRTASTRPPRKGRKPRSPSSARPRCPRWPLRTLSSSQSIALMKRRLKEDGGSHAAAREGLHGLVHRAG